MTRDELVADLMRHFDRGFGDQLATESLLDRLEALGWTGPVSPTTDLAAEDVIVLRTAADLDNLIGNVLTAALDRGLTDDIRGIVKDRFTADRVVGEGRNVRESLLNALSGSSDAHHIADRIIAALRAALAGEEPTPRLIAGETAPAEITT